MLAEVGREKSPKSTDAARTWSIVSRLAEYAPARERPKSTRIGRSWAETWLPGHVSFSFQGECNRVRSEGVAALRSEVALKTDAPETRCAHRPAARGNLWATAGPLGSSPGSRRVAWRATCRQLSGRVLSATTGLSKAAAITTHGLQPRNRASTPCRSAARLPARSSQPTPRHPRAPDRATTATAKSFDDHCSAIAIEERSPPNAESGAAGNWPTRQLRGVSMDARLHRGSQEGSSRAAAS